MKSALFNPLSLRNLKLVNRIAVSPMCQYSARNGCATDWHLIHLGSLALSGAGLLMIEATAVHPVGRITHGDLGLYSDENEKALERVIKACHIHANSVALGIQLAHSGRKGSAHVPWEGGGPLAFHEEPWQTQSPSPLPRDKGWPKPKEMTAEDIAALKKDYVAAAQRANRIGIDLLELHAAHGYLLHEFMSPISNQRNDEYGGSPENRCRLPIEIADLLRQQWPNDKPMGVRITGSDWLEGGLTIDDAIQFSQSLASIGIDYVCVSSGGILPKTNRPNSQDFQIKLAQQVKQNTSIAVRAVGGITKPQEAEDIISSETADFVAIGRAFLNDPRWGWHAAQQLGVPVDYPPQYLRAKPRNS